MVDKKRIKNKEEEEQGEGTAGGGTGTGGASGEVHFRYRDAFSVDPRDDLLPPQEIKRLLSVHKDNHKNLVKKQQLTRKERRALKEGKLQRQTQQSGFGFGGGHVAYKQHPIASKAQFSGIDRQVNNLPNNYDADTNPEQKDALENRLENRLQNRLQNAPKFNPKPRPM